MPPTGIRKRKSKSADNVQKKKEQPVAKKPKIQLKQENANELKPETKKTVPITGRGRGRPKKTANTPKTNTEITRNDAKLSPVKTGKSKNTSSKNKPAKKSVKAGSKKPAKAITAGKKTTKKVQVEEQNGTDVKTEIKIEEPSRDSVSKPAGKKEPTKKKPGARATVKQTSNTEKNKAKKSGVKGKPKVLPQKLSGKGRGRPKKMSPKKSASSESRKKKSNMSNENWKNAKSVYDFTVNNIKGEPVSLEQYKGFVLLIVNVASKCSLTGTNYAQLVELDEKYRDRSLRILAFPCNQFLSQEPGSPDDICQFAKKKNANFDLFEKIDVNGGNAHPLWRYLKDKQSGTFGDIIKWNFTKFLVDKEGKPVARFAPTTEPLAIASNIESLL